MNQLSPEEHDIIKSAYGDRDYRINNIYHVIDDYDNDVIFKQRPIQRYFDQNRWYYNMILKSRQHGITTGELIIMLDEALFRENVNNGLIAHTQDAAERLFQKVRFAYSKLPDIIKEHVKPTKETGSMMRFSNNSSIEVSVSFMAGTLSHLHISEYGYICNKFPEKANEIIRGSVNTLAPKSFLTVESTARGRSGWFYEQCIKALNSKRMNRKLTVKDFRFFFFNWLQNPRDKMDPINMELFPQEEKYFKKLEKTLGFKILPEKKAFYVKTQETQGENMFSEFPTTPEEAFKKKLEGAYYGQLMIKAREEKRIGEYPYQQSYKVNTAWDIGKGDHMAIWFWQKIGWKIFLIDYCSEEDYEMKDYVKYILEKDFTYGVHCLPHDAKQTELQTGATRIQYLRNIGLNRIVLVPKLSLGDGINNVKEVLPNSYFNETPCDPGIMALEEYSKRWDRSLGEYKDEPVKNWAAHPADGFRTMAVYNAIINNKDTNRKSTNTTSNSKSPSSGGWT